jgi:hypothetical protein
LRLARRVLIVVCLVLAAANIYAWPRNKYEWMLTEPDAVRSGLTFCTLPIDPNASTVFGLTVVPILILLALGVLLTLRARRLELVLSGALVLAVLWVVRFWVMRPHC